MSNHESPLRPKNEFSKSLEELLTEQLAGKLDISISSITSDTLETIEHSIELDLRHTPGNTPRNLVFITPQEILERRARVELLLAEKTISS